MKKKTIYLCMMDMVLLQHDTDTIKPEMISKGTLHVHQ